ncbi:hypothetical protein NQD34_015887 [Periophthalmus magnuspinnatus]|nr:hypothetical protein NQD34_015887 [Periophthalmus magnuspinnatus]
MNQSAGAAQHTRKYSIDGGKEIAAIGNDRNWKGIGISLLVIVVVLSLIGLSIVLLSRDDGGKPFVIPLTVDDLFDPNFQIHDPEAKWINDEEIIFRSWDGSVWRANIHNNESSLLLRNTTFATFKASKFWVSPDLGFILLAYDVRPVRTVYILLFLSLSLLVCYLLSREVRELNPPEVSDSVLQFASWGVQGQQLMYIFENNIYYQTDVQSSSWRLTSSGQEGIVFNGIADWLYEVEVLKTPVCHWWSPDGSKLAYLTINNTDVPNMLLPRFTGALYPRGHEYPYPKMGQTNPTVSLNVVNLDGSSRTTELGPPDSFLKSDFYISMVKWVSGESVAVRWVNRAQNMSILCLCGLSSGACTKKHVASSEKWLDRQNEEPFFSKDYATFFITMPLKHGGRGTFSHITMISNQSKDEDVNIRHLTSGSWEVTELVAYDENSHVLYYLSTENGPMQRHLYRVSTVDPYSRECVTCSLFKPHCSFFRVVLSPDYQHVLLHCTVKKHTRPGIPQTTLHKLSNMSSKSTLDNGAELRQFLVNRTIPRWERRIIPINNNALRLELSVPVDLDEALLHPLLLILDSAPGGQAVSELFSAGLGLQCWSALTVRPQTTAEHTCAHRYLTRLPYIDGNRVGVYGKAYGGFLSSLMLLSHSHIFKCAVAVAPITNWRLYGKTKPKKHTHILLLELKKYICVFQISSLIQNFTRTNPVNFLIMHGTADATVHFQHSAELVKLLSSLNVNYTLQIFPDEGHDIASVKSRHYMLSSVVNFFRHCFVPDPEVAPESSKEDD